MALLVMACEKGGEDDQGHSNVDCAPGVLVDGQCTTDPEDCREPGPFADLGVLSLEHAETLSELHVAMGPGAAVHYCYAAAKDNDPMAYYGVQTSSGSVTEEPLTSGGVDALCAALAVDEAGRRFVLARDGSVLSADASGSWASVKLPGLESSEALGALQSDQSVATLTPDREGGVYVGLSLGFDIGAQPAYVARIKDGTAMVLLNGWTESAGNPIPGHAPQVLPMEQPLVVMGDLKNYELIVADASSNVLDRMEGAMPLALATKAGGRILYADRNGVLQIASWTGDKLEPFAVLRQVGRTDTGAQLPWTMAEVKEGGLDVLADVHEGGKRALVHWRIKGKDDVGRPEILSTTLWTQAKGGQRFAHKTDMCGRTTAVIIEHEQGKNPELRLFEQR
jgi:hypothetical protein